MKIIKLRFLLMPITLFITESLIAQTLSSVVPTSTTIGQTIDIIIRGNGTHFQQGLTTLDLGNDIICHPTKVQVQNAQLLTASITVNANAVTGSRDIRVITKNEIATLLNGFEVYNVSGILHTTLEVLPVQTLSLGDLDPSNLANAPFYFWVNVYNDNVRRNVKIELSLKSDKYGPLGIALAPSISINANQFLRLNKNDFPKYKNSPSATSFYKQVLATGAFPADNYTYSVKVTDLKSGETVSDSNMTTITNTKNNPELILPGALYSEPVQTIAVSQPLFQWFGQQNHYDFNLYMVLPGQTAEEAVRNIPVFKTSNIQNNSLLYPNYAEKLIDGQTYAWQINTTISSVKGNQTLPSEVFRFIYSKSLVNQNSVTNPTTSIKVEPQQITLTSGQQFKFIASAYDVNGLPINNVPITWSVTPKDKATIDNNGLLIAGNISGTFAVIANIGGVSDYATVIINDFPAATFQNPWNKGYILKQLFGLPK